MKTESRSHVITVFRHPRSRSPEFINSQWDIYHLRWKACTLTAAGTSTRWMDKLASRHLLFACLFLSLSLSLSYPLPLHLPYPLPVPHPIRPSPSLFLSLSTSSTSLFPSPLPYAKKCITQKCRKHYTAKKAKLE